MTQVEATDLIRVDGVTKRYRSQVAVDALSLAVPIGSIFGLLGENGAGKTTTIQMMLGLVGRMPAGSRCSGSIPRSRGSRFADEPATSLRPPCFTTG